MARALRAALLGALAAAAAAAACGGPSADQAAEEAGARAERLASFSPLPPVPAEPTNRVADDPDAAALGEALFFDPRLSGNGEVSCATCHDPARAFTDGRPLAVGVGRGTRRTPTLWNVAHHRWFTWDGRADTLWMQALDPIEDPREMGGDRRAVVRLIANDPELSAAYGALFGAPPADTATAPEIDAAFVNVGKAIGAFQRTLIRDDAPFDRYVAALAAGDPEGGGHLDARALAGLELFLGKAGCVLCHSGPNFSDSEFHATGVPPRDAGLPEDAGRYDGAMVLMDSPFNAAGPHSDAPEGARARAVRSLRESPETWGEFRTPSLRNLTGRAPFMHQGQFETLEEVIDFYSELEGVSFRNHHQEQLLEPLRLDGAEKDALIAFLRALDGAPHPRGSDFPSAAPR